MVKIMGKKTGKIYLECSTREDANRWIQENFPPKGDKRMSILEEPFVIVAINP